MLSVVLLAAVVGQDWPCWRGADRDGRIPGFEAPAAWPEKLERGWRVEVGEGHATPALVGGRLYVFCRQGEEEVLLCLDAKTGGRVWRSATPAPYTPDPAAKKHGRGPFASPAVADGRVFTYGISGILSAFDAESGKRIWRFDSRRRFPKPCPEWGGAMSPLVDGELVYALVGGKGKGAVIAFEAADGKERWAIEGIPPAYASPRMVEAGGKRQVLFLGQSDVLAADPATGKTLWRQTKFTTAYDQNSVAPVVHGDRVLLFGTKRGVTAAGFGGGGAPDWTSRDVSLYMSDPVLKGGRLYGFSERRRGQFFCLDAGNGRVLWTSDGRVAENAAVLDGGSVIVALTTKSELVVFDASGKEYVERARYTVAESPTWAHPVVSGRTVFIKDAANLTRWTIP